MLVRDLFSTHAKHRCGWCDRSTRICDKSVSSSQAIAELGRRSQAAAGEKARQTARQRRSDAYVMPGQRVDCHPRKRTVLVTRDDDSHIGVTDGQLERGV